MKRCPLCDGESKVIKFLECMDIVKGYEHIYNEKIDATMFEGNYRLRKCKKCSLIFADPMKTGSDAFYSWITKHPNYYPAKDNPRWEWQETVEYIKKNNISSILEIGCGEGAFLEYCRMNISNIQCMGIDMTKDSCEQCEQKGLEVFCGTVEEYLLTYPERKYDIVVSFHCLEHVNNVVEFVEDAMLLCNEKGVSIHSFPYSDKKIEPWLDCGNLPPHHMTRWNEKACLTLGEKVNAQVKLVSPLSDSIYNITKQNLIYTWFPLYRLNEVTRWNVLLKCLKHPWFVFKELFRNLTRDTIFAATEIDGTQKRRKASYVVLVVLKNKNM